MFMGAKGSEGNGKCTVSVIKERMSGGVWALALETKGPNDASIVKIIVKVISEIGSKHAVIVVKSHQEKRNDCNTKRGRMDVTRGCKQCSE